MEATASGVGSDVKAEVIQRMKSLDNGCHDFTGVRSHCRPPTDL
jgi:hypothetical protein